MPFKRTFMTAVMTVFVSASAYAGDLSVTAKQDCIEATSDYERYELGCSIDVAGTATAASSDDVATAPPVDAKP